MMRVLGQLTLGQQLPDGLGCKPIAGAHGRMAGHQAEMPGWAASQVLIS